jgi:hypothetical protein
MMDIVRKDLAGKAVMELIGTVSGLTLSDYAEDIAKIEGLRDLVKIVAYDIHTEGEYGSLVCDGFTAEGVEVACWFDFHAVDFDCDLIDWGRL